MSAEDLSSWVIDLSEPPTPGLELPSGHCLVALVRAKPPASPQARDLILMASDEAVVVRSVPGRLLWGESRSSLALPAPDDATRVERWPVNAGVSLPRDYGAEALAMLDIDRLCDWACAQTAESTHGERVELESQYGSLTAEFDRDGHWITRVAFAAAPTVAFLSMAHSAVVPTNPTWFDFAHRDRLTSSMEAAGIAWATQV